MNWKHEAVDKLRGYEAHKRAMALIPLESGGWRTLLPASVAP